MTREMGLAGELEPDGSLGTWGGSTSRQSNKLFVCPGDEGTGFEFKRNSKSKSKSNFQGPFF